MSDIECGMNYEFCRERIKIVLDEWENTLEMGISEKHRDNLLDEIMESLKAGF